MILTEQDLERALNKDYQKTIDELVECADLMLKGNRMLTENQLSREEYKVLQEGLWEKIKYGLSKLGRYKAGGKILGKGKIDQEAGAKIQSILDKKGNEIIKNLNTVIKKENPEFPNNKEGEKFLKTVMEIAAVYDSVVAATKKKPDEEGYLPTDAANSIIADLAEYVKKFLDVDLSAAYTVMDSEEDKVKNGEEELLTDEVEDINEDEAADVRAKLQAKGGDTQYDTKRMGKEGLKSNKLPMTLVGVGASLGAFSWLVNTQWFKSIFETIVQNPTVEHVKQVVETKSDVFGSIKPGQGMTQLMNEMNGLGLNPQSSPEDFLNGVKQLGGGNLEDGINALAQKGGIFRDPAAAREVLAEIAKNPHGHGDTLGEIFKDKWAGTGKSVGDALVTVEGGTLKGLIVKTIVTSVPKIVMKSSIKMGAGYAIAKGFGAVLGPIGVGLVAAGALVKLMRMKGQKQSRAKTLNDLLQSLQPIKAEEATLPPVLPNPKPNPVEGEGGGGKANKEQLFNDLAGFFKFTYNNRKMAAPGIFGDKAKDPCSKLDVGMDVLYKPNKEGKELIYTVTKLLGDGMVQLKVKEGAKKPAFAIACSKVKPVKKSEGGKQLEIPFGESINRYVKNILMENEKLILISEGKFIKDPEVIKILNKKSGIDGNKLKFFEGFLTRLEIIRNKVKKMNNTGDKVLDQFVEKLKSNPIMTKDFTKTFNIDPGNPQNVENMGRFINDLIEIVYKGRFRGKKIEDIEKEGLLNVDTFNKEGGAVGKMGKLGGGNINKVSMGESYLIERKGKKAKAKSDFKNSIINFITELMSMFQYMYKLKKQGKLSGGSKENKSEPKQNKPESKPEPKQESIKNTSPLLNEEIGRIKKLMK